MEDDLTHRVTITIIGKYMHGEKEHASVSINGDGGIEHMFDAFKVALLAAGYPMVVVNKLDELDF